MKLKSLFFYTFLIAALSFLSSCEYTEDPGPIQEISREFSTDDFDRLEIGDALHIDVEQGNFFEIVVRGDRRNVDDLDVYTEGETLIIRFDEDRNRRHQTYITITMPSLRSVNFSGATSSRISGFYDLDNLDVYLSGASVSQLDVDATNLDAVISGASILTARGEGENVSVELSGASVLKAFEYSCANATLNVTGASTGKVSVSNLLEVTATGASSVYYRGNPVVDADLSGSSTVQQD